MLVCQNVTSQCVSPMIRPSKAIGSGRRASLNCRQPQLSPEMGSRERGPGTHGLRKHRAKVAESIQLQASRQLRGCETHKVKAVKSAMSETLSCQDHESSLRVPTAGSFFVQPGAFQDSSSEAPRTNPRFGERNWEVAGRKPLPLLDPQNCRELLVSDLHLKAVARVLPGAPTHSPHVTRERGSGELRR